MEYNSVQHRLGGPGPVTASLSHAVWSQVPIPDRGMQDLRSCWSHHILTSWHFTKGCESQANSTLFPLLFPSGRSGFRLCVHPPAGPQLRPRAARAGACGPSAGGARITPAAAQVVPGRGCGGLRCRIFVLLHDAVSIQARVPTATPTFPAVPADFLEGVCI